VLLTRAYARLACLIVASPACGARTSLPLGGRAPDVEAGVPGNEPMPEAAPPPVPPAPPCESYVLDEQLGDFVLSDRTLDIAWPAALVFHEGSYVAMYSGARGQSVDMYTVRFDGGGAILEDHAVVVPDVAEQYPRSLVWAGDRFGLGWTRFFDGSYEARFSILDSARRQLEPGDVLPAEDSATSVAPDLVWTGSEFVVSWAGLVSTRSLRPDVSTREHVFARRLDRDAKLLAGIVVVDDDAALDSDAPDLALGGDVVGMTWGARTDSVVEDDAVLLKLYDRTLNPLGPKLRVNEPESRASGARGVWDGEAFVVAWYERGPTAQSIWAARVDASGRVVVPPRIVTDSPANARSPFMVPTGRSTWVVFSDDRDGNGGYELYAEKRTADLAPAEPAFRITRASGQSIYPIAMADSGVEIVVIFEDDRDGTPRVYATRLLCNE
jgi:hypothetical protein